MAVRLGEVWRLKRWLPVRETAQGGCAPAASPILRSEGMGLCRTVIEQHGGALDFGPALAGAGAGAPETGDTPASATPPAPVPTASA